MKTQINNSSITLFKSYLSSGRSDLAAKVENEYINEDVKKIEFLLGCLELWVQFDNFNQAKNTIRLLSEAQYPSSACELCLQLVKFRLGKIETSQDGLKCAHILLSANMLDEAEKVLCDALKLEPDNLSIKTELAKFYLDIGELNLAATMAEEVVNIDNSTSKSLTVYGNALRIKGDTDHAYEIHQKALLIDPESYESLLDVTAIDVSRAKSELEFEECIKSSNKCLQIYIGRYYKLDELETSLCKIKHDNEQAKYLVRNECLQDLKGYIELTDDILYRLSSSQVEMGVKLSNAELGLIKNYNQYNFIYDQYANINSCLNSSLDWDLIADKYNNSSPSLVVIDDFLNIDALNYLRRFCHESKVWHKTYQHGYLGAFVDKGFLSKVHLKISKELQSLLSNVIQGDRLEQLWAFKYDSVLGKGINIHADFARINLNFWITPDEYHLNKDHGGLIVYTEPAPRDWNYFDYNVHSAKIYNYLDHHNSNCVTVPYKANRAVLFDSTLFHETDEIKFVDSYLGRRVNMTYLFGVQLK